MGFLNWASRTNRQEIVIMTSWLLVTLLLSVQAMFSKKTLSYHDANVYSSTEYQQYWRITFIILFKHMKLYLIIMWVFTVITKTCFMVTLISSQYTLMFTCLALSPCFKSTWHAKTAWSIFHKHLPASPQGPHSEWNRIKWILCLIIKFSPKILNSCKWDICHLCSGTKHRLNLH